MLLAQIGDGRTLEDTVRLDAWIIDTRYNSPYASVSSSRIASSEGAAHAAESRFFRLDHSAAVKVSTTLSDSRRKWNFPDWLDVGKRADAWKYRPFQVRPGSSCPTSATNSHISG